MIVLSFAFLAGGLAGIVYGADLLVKGASRLALGLGVSPLFVGITIVAVGTSLPELVVNLFGVIQGASDIGYGNVVGSNVFNILAVLGAAALIRDIPISRATTRIEIPLCVLSAAVLLIVANDPFIGGAAVAQVQRSEGLLMLGFFLVFVAYTVTLARKDPEAAPFVPDESPETSERIFGRSVLQLLAGLILLVVGGRFVVTGATDIALIVGLSERVVAILIVAVGTSLPELATSVAAARAGELDIAVGNALGSCLLNAFLILGLTASIQPVPIPTGSNLDLFAYLASSILLFLFVFTGRGRKIDRREGGVFMMMYGAYVIALFLV
ncbi:MAG: calcium/sodium antiporter [Spirochaetaceae bacterium]